MSVADIVAKIYADASHEIEKKEQASREAHDALIALHRTEEEKQQNAFYTKQERVIELHRARVVMRARKEAQSSLLATRHAIIDALFSEVANTIASFDDTAYSAWLSRYLTSLPKGFSAEKCLVPAEREQLSKKILKKHDITVKEFLTTESRAGLILDGVRETFDFSLESILARYREKNEVAIARILFNHTK